MADAPKSSASLRWDASITLDYHQQELKWQNAKGQEFYLRRIHYDGGETASVSGPAILMDGSRGVTDRYGLMPLMDLPHELVVLLLRETASLLR